MSTTHMSARQARLWRKQQGISMLDPLWWAIESTARIDEMLESLRHYVKREKSMDEGTFKTTFYVQEWVQSYPFKFDYVGKRRPGTFHHKVRAVDREDALRVLTQRLMTERGITSSTPTFGPASEPPADRDTEVSSPTEDADSTEDTTDQAA